MMCELFSVYPLATGIFLLASFTSVQSKVSLLELLSDYTQADGFIFDGPARKPEINMKENSMYSPYLTTPPGTHYYGKSTQPPLINTFSRCFDDCPSQPGKRLLCGSDGVTYLNAQQVHCAQKCGKYVQVSFEGPCNQKTTATYTIYPTTTTATTTTATPGTTTTDLPIVKLCRNNCQKTQEFNPVCGTDGVTYDNARYLECAKICGKKVEIVGYGRCT